MFLILSKCNFPLPNSVSIKVYVFIPNLIFLKYHYPNPSIPIPTLLHATSPLYLITASHLVTRVVLYIFYYCLYPPVVFMSLNLYVLIVFIFFTSFQVLPIRYGYSDERSL